MQLIAEFMIENGYCTAATLPKTAIAWDLVRIANLGRWAFHCGYLSEAEMWQVMQVAADAAHGHFASWEEYGLSFTLGRGVWHGDEEDCQTPGRSSPPCRRTRRRPGGSLRGKSNRTNGQPWNGDSNSTSCCGNRRRS